MSEADLPEGVTRCQRCDELTRFGGLCGGCIAEDMDFDPDEGLCDCHGETWEQCPNNFDCGMLADGTCMLAGTEDCDWECPFH